MIGFLPIKELGLGSLGTKLPVDLGIFVLRFMSIMPSTFVPLIFVTIYKNFFPPFKKEAQIHESHCSPVQDGGFHPGFGPAHYWPDYKVTNYSPNRSVN